MDDRNNNFHLRKTSKSRSERIKKRVPLKTKSYNSEELNVLDVDNEFSRLASNKFKLPTNFRARSKKYKKRVPLRIHSHSEHKYRHDDVRDEFSQISLNSKIRYLNRTRDEENASEIIFEEDLNDSSTLLVNSIILCYL